MARLRRADRTRQRPPSLPVGRRKERDVFLPVAIRHGRHARSARYGHQSNERLHRQARHARACGIYQNSRQRSDGKGRRDILRHKTFFKRVFNQGCKSACAKRRQRISFRHRSSRAYVLVCNPSSQRDRRRYDNRVAQSQDIQRLQSVRRRRSADVARIDG